MPEIAEVARVVHYIRQYLVGKTLSTVVAVDDANVYGKVGTSGTQFQKLLPGRKIVDAGQQGKYFWMVMDEPPHPLMHLGMNGWLKIHGEKTYYYSRKGGDGDEGDLEERWPPKYWKFHLETMGDKKVKAAFVDSRRFARIRLVDCAAEDLRNVSPLKENGPDPVADKDLVTVEWVVQLCRKKRIPIKALLLDQANISGIGNWVGDEIMYHAKIHPEQYSNSLSDDQLRQLHHSIHFVCSTAVEALADSDLYPQDWLFKHRWGKGRKDAANALPNGNKIAFLTVGGRTSAIVPSVQRKTGQVAKALSDDDDDGGGNDEQADKSKKKTAVKATQARTKGNKRTHDRVQASAATSEKPELNGTAKTKSGSAKRPRNSTVKEEPTDQEETATAAGEERDNKEERKSPKEEKTTGSTIKRTKISKSDNTRTDKRQQQRSSQSNGNISSGAPEPKRRSTRLSRG